MKIKLPTLECTRCSYSWHPKQEKLPVRCPACGSPYWNKERKKDVKVRDAKKAMGKS